ncbi:hypothetical protein KI387_018057, partial [Taxus chinensis]
LRMAQALASMAGLQAAAFLEGGHMATARLSNPRHSEAKFLHSPRPPPQQPPLLRLGSRRRLLPPPPQKAAAAPFWRSWPPQCRWEPVANKALAEPKSIKLAGPTASLWGLA